MDEYTFVENYSTIQIDKCCKLITAVSRDFFVIVQFALITRINLRIVDLNN